MSEIKIKQNKYHVEVYDILKNEWRDGGNFPTYYGISERYGYTYDNVRDIKNGRSKQLSKIFRINKIKKLKVKIRL